MISIEGLDKAKVLAALYNAARPQGLGFLQYDEKPMTEEEARELLRGQTYFDYLKGRVMKVDLSGDSLREDMYDRDNGAGSVERILSILRATGETNSLASQVMHEDGKHQAADYVREHLPGETEFNDGPIPSVHLGLSEFAKELGPAVDRATE